MIGVTIEFRFIHGISLSKEHRAEISKVRSAVANVLRGIGKKVGAPSSSPNGAAVIHVTGVDEKFAIEHIIPKLEEIGMIDRLKVYTNVPDGENKLLYPDS